MRSGGRARLPQVLRAPNVGSAQHRTVTRPFCHCNRRGLERRDTNHHVTSRNALGLGSPDIGNRSYGRCSLACKLARPWDSKRRSSTRAEDPSKTPCRARTGTCRRASPSNGRRRDRRCSGSRMRPFRSRSRTSPPASPPCATRAPRREDPSTPPCLRWHGTLRRASARTAPGRSWRRNDSRTPFAHSS